MDDHTSSCEDTGEDFTRMDRGDSSSAEFLLAQELNQLSVQERDLINDEIHGVRLSCPNETPELLQNSLANLESELGTLPSTPTKSAYEESLKHPESYVHKDDFRLMFLRCEFFDAPKAALRMIKYLDLVYYAFGSKALKRDICLADFDSKGKEFLREGYHQVLPGMDRTGRRVTGNFAFAFDPDQPVKNQVKSAIYCMMRTGRGNINVQRMGIVGLYWAFGTGSFQDLKRRFWVHKRFVGAEPIRFCAIHFCLPESTDPIFSALRRTYLMSLAAKNRARLRIHSGSATECLYTLQTFGIQAIHMPINTTSGEIKTTNHHKWLRLQKIQEDDKVFCGIECPEQADVLFGRGWPKMGHPGNAHFRNAIECRLDDYNAAHSKREKTLISWSVVSELRDSGARFLKEDESGFWMEVSDEVARKKISTGFRDIRKARHKMVQSLLKNTNNKSVSLPGSKRKVPSEECGGSSDEDSSKGFQFVDGGKRHRENSKCTCKS